ncbi:hypothetical protein K474DRAFT_1676886 [Panus rudis PR-1116 ss-1]|nr:hypothetical protein K474DRAFT_1676886 [Panus rudis PR-1116 ss-1]
MSERDILLHCALCRRTNEFDLGTIGRLYPLFITYYIEKTLASCGIRTNYFVCSLLITKLEGGVVQLRPRSFVTGNVRPRDQSGHGTLYGLTDKRTAAQNALVSQSEDGPAAGLDPSHTWIYSLRGGIGEITVYPPSRGVEGPSRASR